MRIFDRYVLNVVTKWQKADNNSLLEQIYKTG